MSPTFYDAVKSYRETPQNLPKQYNRIMLAGYLNEQFCKRNNIADYEKIIKDSIRQYIQSHQLQGYLYLKGCFYIHIIETVQIDTLNEYLNKFYKSMCNQPFNELHKQIRVVYQSYQSSEQLFRKWQCYQNQQSGPILIESDKLEEQILQRAQQIYYFFEDGARTKMSNNSHKIGNMILLNNDDMSILISKQFMSLEEYIEIYVGEIDITKEADLNYPLPPNMFKMLEFMQTEDYKSFS